MQSFYHLLSLPESVCIGALYWMMHTALTLMELPLHTNTHNLFSGGMAPSSEAAVI